MNSAQAIGVFSVLSGILGIAAFVWAIRHRQIRITDEEAFKAVEGADDPTVAAPQPLSLQARLLIGTIIAIFLFIGWSVVLTILAATHAHLPPEPPAQHGAAGPT